LQLARRSCNGLNPRGQNKPKTGTPVVGGWVRALKRDGFRFIFSIFCIVFSNSPHRETPKNVIKQNQENRFWIFGRIFCKNFSTRFVLQNVFCMFLNSHRSSLRNTRKRDKTTKKSRKNWHRNFCLFLGKVFNMDFL
jgi:hypothetical protein